jgi:hypothetical protein
MKVERALPARFDREHGASHTSFIVDGTATARPAVTDVDDAAQALFEEARRRTRRRRRRQAAVVGLCTLGAGAAWLGARGGGDGSPTGHQPQRAVTHVMPEQILAQPPYMGVACLKPNSIACDRVGLAVWTKDPVERVAASIGGRSFTLRFEGCCGPQTPSNRPRQQFMGFLHHAGLRGTGPLAVQVENGRNRFTGLQAVTAPVRITVTYGDGSQQVTTVWLDLAPGWG